MILLPVLLFLSLLLGEIVNHAIFPGIFVYLHDVVLAVTVVILLLPHLKKFRLLKGVLIRPLLLFVFIGVVSLLVNLDRYAVGDILTGSLYLVRFCLYALLYVAIVNSKFRPQMWLKGLYFWGVGLAILGFVQLLYYPSLRNLIYLGWDEHYYRLFSTLLDPNFAGMILTFSFLLGIYFFQTYDKRVFALTESIIGVALLFTYSRSSFLAILAGLCTWAVIKKQKAVFIVILAGIVIYNILPNHSIDTNRLFRTETSVARISNWNKSLSLFVKSPFIGIGFNTLRAQAKQDRTIDINGIISRDAAGLNSSVFVILVTTGLVGLGSYIYLAKYAYELVMSHKGLLRLVGITSLIAVFIHSWFNNTLFYPVAMIWVWILLGSIELDQAEKKSTKKK